MLRYVNQTFFSNSFVNEPMCSHVDCTSGQRTYRGLLVKFMAKSAMVAPYITMPIQWTLLQNGMAIAQMCSDPVGDNSTCTIQGQMGIGEQLTGLNSVVSLLIGRGQDEGQNSSNGEASSAAAGSLASVDSMTWWIWGVMTLLCVVFQL